ncbi:hypothetical protein COCC4DRAFT_61887 [Bipolaris maydis ATCC 48331]|uniref:F-box domain-containing protein n=2 Tax=Cochliobolus heterostrophus TaxID=5016 RepID=M2UGM1_COCH5|nr:uncharacterized protein COCC4DRAFT_61887 [Bipolaris maydis ATCC 48331]EMD87138.1 hypothetical protein COCHEDRAFT_1197974 [Bipolaris maydis C5]KAJ5021551.1 hypothetical protein J3E73DRAFT_19526 [Bipolaris maydis]ENI03868.1 hypothetical protein COCC4DRAFT_61887 [Bipolaris maydis ATCC 48331]KAJ6192826.1 hypothetical protein J3E72DRAFT_389124 [Bipolaris maydis]KAJ6204445.1 hypothetical protein PSV09DRAFT_1197974 [Bipolaris maydis]
MTANVEGDAFSRLPVELRIKILKLSPDLFSLRSLAHASPALGRVLDRYPLEILEVVLDVTVSVETRRLMSAVLKARFSRFPASLSEAQKVAKIDSPAITDEMRSVRLDRAAAAVRSMLTTAENVHAWSHACLEHLIRKSMELRPATFVHPFHSSLSWERWGKVESHDDYIPQYTGPPSWVEEQRVVKAFWRLQFLLELQGASNKSRLMTYWPAQEVDVLSKSSPDDFYEMFPYQQDQTLTACDFFGGVTSGTITSVEAVHDNTHGLPTIRWTENTVPRWPCAEPLSFEINKDFFRQGQNCVDLTPPSYHFQYLMSIPHPEGESCLLGLPFQPYRKYGFAIWDEKRMVDLGMRDPKRKSLLANRIFYSFRWWSILTEEELQQGLRNRDRILNRRP